MSTNSAKKKRLGSRRRVTNQNKTSEADEFLVTDSTSVAQHSIPEENKKSVNEFAYTDNLVSQTQNPPSPELRGNRRKLGSSRRNKGGRHVEDSATDTQHKLGEEVEGKSRGNESPETTQVSLAFQPEEDGNLSKGYEHDVSWIQESLSYLSEEEHQSVYSVKEKESENTEVLTQDGNLQSNSLVSESNVESSVTHLSAPPVETTATKSSTNEHTEIEYELRQETFSSPNESTNEEEHEILNLSRVKDAQHSDDDASNFIEETMKKTQMYGIHNDNEHLSHEINDTEIFSDNLLDQVEFTFRSIDDDSTKQKGSSPDDKNDEQKNIFEAFDDMTEGNYVYDAEKPPTSDTDRPDTEVGQLHDKEGRLDYHIKPSDQQTCNQKTVHAPAAVNSNNPSLQLSHSEIETPFDSLLQVSFVTEDEHNDADFSPTGRKLGSSHKNKQGQQMEDSDGESCCKPTQEVEENTFGYKELETQVSLPIEIAMPEKSVESVLEEITTFNTCQSGKLSSQVKDNLHVFVISDESSPQEHSENEWSVEKAKCPSPKEELSTIEEQREMFTLSDIKSTHQTEDAVNTAHDPEVKTTQSHEMEEIHPSSEDLIHDVTDYYDFFSGHLINQDEVIDQFGSTVKITDDSVTKQEHSNPDDTKEKHHTEESNLDAFDCRNEDYNEGPQIGEKEKVDTALGQVYEIEGRVEDDMKLISEQTDHLEKIEMEESKSFQTMQSDIQVSLNSQPLQNNPTTAEPYHRSTEEDMEMTKDYESLETTMVETDVEDNSIETTLTEIDMFDNDQTEEVSSQVKHNADVGTLIDVSEQTSSNLHLSSTVDQKLAVQSSLEMSDKELHNLYCLTEKEKSDMETKLLRPDVNLQGNYLVDESCLKSEENDFSFVPKITTENHSPPGDTEPKCSIKHGEFSSQKIDVEQTHMQGIHYSSERVTDDDTENSAILSGHPTDQVSDTYPLELIMKSTEFANMHKNPDPDDNVLHHAEEGILPDVQEHKLSLKNPPLDVIAPLDNPFQDYSNSSKEQTQTDSNLIKKRKKMGSSRRYKDRQQAKDSVEHKEDVNEELVTSQMVLVTERVTQEELHQGSYYDTTISEKHDDPMLSGILDYEAQSSTKSNYPETILESLLPGSESRQADHVERERHFRVEDSNKSMLVNLEGMDKSVFLNNEDAKGAHHSEDDLKEEHENNVKPTQVQDMQEIDSITESVLHDSSKNVEIISGNLIKEAEIRNIYESELTVKSIDDSLSKQEDLHPLDKLEENPIKYGSSKVEPLELAKNDDHVNDSKKPEQISNAFREDTSPGQANKTEGHVEDEIKPCFGQTGYQEKEGLFFWDEDSESSLQTLPAEMPAPNSQEQQIDWKLGKDSSAESYNRHTEEIVQETGDNKQVETTKIPLTGETAEQEKMDTILKEMQPIDTAQTKEVCDQDKTNDHVSSIVDEPNSLSLHSTSTVDEQPVGQSNVMEMPGEKCTQVVCSVSEKENIERDTEKDFFRQDGNIQGNYEMSQSAFTQEIPTEKDQPGDHPDNESVEQEESTELSSNEEEKESLSQVSIGHQSGGTVNEIHEEEVKSTQVEEVHQHIYCSVEESDSSVHALQSETNVSSDSELQQINLIGNSSCHRNRERQHVKNTVTDTFYEPKEENLSQLTEFDKSDLTLSPKELGLKDGLDIENTPYHDDIVFTGSSDPLEQEDDYHNQNKEALSYDKEEKSDMQKTNDAVETVGHITIDDHNREASTVAGSVSEKDEVDGKLKDSMRTDQQAQDNMASQDITESEFFAKHKTDSLVPLDTGLVVNSKAEQAVDVAEEIGTDQEKFKQRKRKFGSNRRTLHKVNPERGQENKDESKRVEFKTEPEVRDFEKKEVMDEFPALATADVSMNEKGKPSLSLVCIPQSKTDETSSVLDLGQMLQSRYSDPKALESSTIPDKNLLLSSNTEECTNIGITGGSFVSLDETTQGSQNDEERPESANALQQQALKSTEKQVVAVEDLEIVKAVVIGGEEEQNNVKPSMQESSNVEEGAQKTDLEMKNASPNLNSTQPRRKLGSTRKNLRSKTKDEELPQKQEVDDKAIETTTNAEDVKTNFVSGIQEEELKLPVEQEDIDSVQKKDRVLETVEYSHTGESHLTPKAHQTSEENPVSGSESEHQQAPNYHLPIPSTTPKEDVMSESAAGGRKRKMGSNRKSRGQQKNREETAREDHIINKENGSDGGSVTDESAVKTVEEELLGLHETSGIEKTNKKESPNSRTSKAGGDTKPVSEKKPEQQTPVQRPSADIRLGQEGHQTFSLAGDSSVDRSNSYNVVMVGDSSVGKTSFMKRAQSGKFSLDIPASIGVDCCLWTVVVDGKPVVLQLWDTAGQERFHSITRQIFHKAQAFLLMYDISSAYSFSAVSYWASCIQEGAPENVTVLLVGNKSDHAERRVKTQEGETLAKEYNFEFMECSAATGENVIESLETMARMLSQKIGTREEATLSFKEPQKKKSSGCC